MIIFDSSSPPIFTLSLFLRSVSSLHSWIVKEAWEGLYSSSGEVLFEGFKSLLEGEEENYGGEVKPSDPGYDGNETDGANATTTTTVAPPTVTTPAATTTVPPPTVTTPAATTTTTTSSGSTGATSTASPNEGDGTVVGTKGESGAASSNLALQWTTSAAAV
eukprot:CAMPEP_0113584958 /NCGR_PEP_ID=MMETSP0015_2-20120614/33398_1 /TAXON_ID=2838 /ORGANISM="Odontella" /LENGTH=161 /DNA_ID=CAMNT_0000490077 /DNA_START=93 /DNA_END=574 /DNA_ORIENTATION=+ /assembly_acc=CAM_ASM_000160